MRKRMVTKFMALAAIAMVGMVAMVPTTAHAEEVPSESTLPAEVVPPESALPAEEVVPQESTLTPDDCLGYIPGKTTEPVTGDVAYDYNNDPAYELIRRHTTEEQLEISRKYGRPSTPEEIAGMAGTPISEQTVSEPVASEAPVQATSPEAEQASVQAKSSVDVTTGDAKPESSKKSDSSSSDKNKAEIKGKTNGNKTDATVKDDTNSEKKVEKAVSAARSVNDKNKVSAETVTKDVEDEPTGMEAVIVTLKATVGNGVAAVQAFFGNIAKGIRGVFEGFVSLF